MMQEAIEVIEYPSGTPTIPAAPPPSSGTDSPGHDKPSGPGEEQQEKSGEQAGGEPKQQEDPFAPKFARLAKRDKELRERDQALKEREQRIAVWERTEALKDEDPLKYLEARGLSYDELTRRMLNGGGRTEADERIEKLEAFAKEQQEAAERAEQMAVEQAVMTMKRDIAGSINGSEAYEILQSEGDDGVEVVYQMMRQHYQRTSEAGEPRILSPDEACAMAEKYFEEQTSKRLGLKKFQNKTEPSEGSQSSSDLPGQPVSDRPDASTDSPRTLTNGHAAASSRADKRPMSDEENRARAAALLRWKE